MAKNKHILLAKKIKNDEFYTRLEDIEKIFFKEEVRETLKGKHIYMNCDDPRFSNFWGFFYDNFEALGLKKITATHLNINNEKFVYRYDFDGKETSKTPLQEDGDFRSEECKEILEECDIVITNPPFSLFSEYIEILMDYKKDFYVIAPLHSIKYKPILYYTINKKIFFINKRANFFKTKDNKIKSVNGIWITNLDQIQKSFLDKNYFLFNKIYKENLKDYPVYDNFPAIEVTKSKNIPLAYDGIMGVPESFLSYLDYDFFEIVGISHTKVCNDINKKYNFPLRLFLNKKSLYTRIFIRWKLSIEEQLKLFKGKNINKKKKEMIENFNL